MKTIAVLLVLCGIGLGVLYFVQTRQDEERVAVVASGPPPTDEDGVPIPQTGDNGTRPSDERDTKEQIEICTGFVLIIAGFALYNDRHRRHSRR